MTFKFSDIKEIVVHYFGMKKTQLDSFKINASDNEDQVNYVTIFVSLALVFVAIIFIIIIIYRCRKNLPRVAHNSDHHQNHDFDDILHIHAAHPINHKAEDLKKLKDFLETNLSPIEYKYLTNEFQNNCTICLEEFLPDSVVVKLGTCKHIFQIVKIIQI